MTEELSADRNLALPRPFRFSDQDRERIHEASLRILDRTGVRFHEPQALELFAKAGARVEDGNLVRIPAKLIEWALGLVPKQLTLYDRNGQPMIDLSGDKCHYGVGSDCTSIYDIRTGLHRRAVMTDLAEAHHLADAMPNVDFIMSMVLPEDAPIGKHEPIQMASMLINSTKPVVFVGEQDWSTISALEMAAEVAGGMEELAAKPFVVNYVNTLNSFQHNQESVRRLMYAAERNIPSIYAPPTTRAVSGPITPAGAQAVAGAGKLAGVVLSQLVREGSPVIVSSGGGTMDMRTMVSQYVAPDPGMGAWDMLQYYGLPVFGFGGCSDSKIFDAQAAGDAVLSLMTNTAGGAHMIHDMGYLDCAMTYSYEMLAYSDEIVGWLKRAFRQIEVNDETLALDLIEETAPDKDFMGNKLTLKYVRQEWMPDLMDRNNFSRWRDAGSTTLQDRARTRVLEMMAEHTPEPLPAQTVARVEAIRDRYVG